MTAPLWFLCDQMVLTHCGSSECLRETIFVVISCLLYVFSVSDGPTLDWTVQMVEDDLDFKTLSPGVRSGPSSVSTFSHVPLTRSYLPLMEKCLTCYVVQGELDFVV